MKSLYQSFYSYFYGFGKRNFGRKDSFSIWIVFFFLKTADLAIVLSFFKLEFIIFNRYLASFTILFFIIDYFFLLKKDEKEKIKKMDYDNYYSGKSKFMGYLMFFYVTGSIILIFISLFH